MSKLRETFVGLDKPVNAGVALTSSHIGPEDTFRYEAETGWFESRYRYNTHLGYWHIIPVSETPRVSACMAYAIVRTDTGETLAYVSKRDLADAIASQVSALLGASLVSVTEVAQ